MNCVNFESIVDELARNRMMEAGVREQALLHSTSCEKCSLRFRDEQTLTNGLSELAALMQAETTPESIESNVLAEFRSRRKQGLASTPNRFVPLAVGSVDALTSRRSYWTYGVAAAAMIVIVLGLTAVRFRTTSVVSGPVESSGPTPAPESVAMNADSVAPVSATVSGPGENQENLTERAPRRNVRRTVRNPISSRPDSIKSTVTVQSLEILAADVEVTTDFIPMAFANASNLQEGGQVVRLEMPRYAMARFGVPVNHERYDERVKADVWLGADGLARAIRFVQ